MLPDTEHIWKEFGEEFYFFILKRLRDEEAAREILQNSFLKIHSHLGSLKDSSKLRAWAYQIVRNEIVNYHNRKGSGVTVNENLPENPEPQFSIDRYCCSEKFIENLPEKYYQVIEAVYLKGHSQAQAAALLNITLANAKARIRRAREILKSNFRECCKYQLNSQGLLVGEPDCGSCTE